MPGTTSTALPSFSHDQHHKTDVAKLVLIILVGDRSTRA